MQAESLSAKGHPAFGPSTMTILPTYRCSAACSQCCFGSNPDVQERLTLDEIKDAIRQGARDFPRLQLICFSGGECYLLGDELIEAIRCAHEHNLMVRTVSNGFWAKSPKAAARIMRDAKEAGLTEMNISTGRDHAQYVPLSSVVNAAVAAVNEGIITLVTVEQDGPDTEINKEINSAPQLLALKKEHPRLFSIGSNTWMKFNEEHVPRTRGVRLPAGIDSGCDQLFGNLVVTPYGKVSSCCGLTFEYIPEMKVGSLMEGENALAAAYTSQLNDFLKIWVHTDGPIEIIRKVAPHREQEFDNCEHICQACAKLYRDPELRQAVKTQYSKHVPDVLTRHRLRVDFVNRTGMPVI